MSELLTFASLLALGVKIVSTLKFIENQDWRSLRIQVTAWVVTTILVFWGAEIQGIRATVFDGIALSDLGNWTKLYLGLTIGSAGSLLVDKLRSDDNASTSKV